MTVSFLPLSRCAYCQDCQFRFLLADNQQWNGDRPIGSFNDIRGICEASLVEVPAIVSINDVGAIGETSAIKMSTSHILRET